MLSTLLAVSFVVYPGVTARAARRVRSRLALLAVDAPFGVVFAGELNGPDAPPPAAAAAAIKIQSLYRGWRARQDPGASPRPVVRYCLMLVQPGADIEDAMELSKPLPLGDAPSELPRKTPGVLFRGVDSLIDFCYERISVFCAFESINFNQF